jgi:hypothetical protein
VHGERVARDQIGERVVVQRGEQVVVARGGPLQVADQCRGAGGEVVGRDRRTVGRLGMEGRPGAVVAHLRGGEPRAQGVGAWRERAADGAGRVDGDVEHRGPERPADGVAAHGAKHPVEEREGGERRRVGRRRGGRGDASGSRPVARLVGGRRIGLGVGGCGGAAQRAHGGGVDAQEAAHGRGLVAGEERRGAERGAQPAGGDAEEVGQLARVDLARLLGRFEPRDEQGGAVGGRRMRTRRASAWRVGRRERGGRAAARARAARADGREAQQPNRRCRPLFGGTLDGPRP